MQRTWYVSPQIYILTIEESLAYLDIEGEQNKILEDKTIELQRRIENEIKEVGHNFIAKAM